LNIEILRLVLLISLIEQGSLLQVLIWLLVLKE